MNDEIISIIKKSNKILVRWLFTHYDQYHVFFIAPGGIDIEDFIWYSNKMDSFHIKLMEIGFQPEFNYNKGEIVYRLPI